MDRSDSTPSHSIETSPTRTSFTTIRRTKGRRLTHGNYLRKVKGSPIKGSTLLGAATAHTLSEEVIDGDTNPLGEWFDEIPSAGEAKKGKKKQGASVEMKAFTDNMDRLLDLLLMRESDVNLDDKCSCGGGKATMRCLECMQPTLQCTSCIRSAHRHQPFHWVQQQKGQYFVRVDLESIGFELCLGHGGHRCKNIATGQPPTPMTVVHHNGIHKVNIAWCQCPDSGDHVDQLMLHGLFPATLTSPQTAFTFEMLNQAHIHILQSKKSAYDYIWALRRLTNNVFTSDTPDRYREYNRVGRVWSHLKALKRAGYFFRLQEHLPHLPKDSFALTCPACPQNGFNTKAACACEGDSGVPKSMEDDKAPEYVHRLFLGADGNFHARRKNKLSKTDPDDISLGNGKRIFVESKSYKTFIDKVESDPRYNKNEKPPATCSGFRAGDARRAIKDKGLAVSGIVAVMCARHGCFRPQGMVDLFVGERYHIVDYALAKACEGVESSQEILLTYDVACRYDKNQKVRFHMWLPEDEALLDNMDFCVPKMHLLAHKEDCQYRYALDHRVGVGMTHGETVEHPWAEGNQTGSSTQEMNAGHRADALDDFFSFWNWSKNQRLPDYIGERLVVEIEERDKLDAAFRDTTSSIDKELIKKWKAEIGVRPHLVEGEWQSIFRPRLGKAPSRNAILDELSQMEQAFVIGDHTLSTKDIECNVFKGTASFINTGISLMLKQWETREKLQKWSAELTLGGDRAQYQQKVSSAMSALRSSLSEWRGKHSQFMPSIDSSYISGPDVDEENPQGSILGLPSDVDSNRHEELELTDIAQLELKLWEGVAYDIITTLKEQIKFKKCFLAEKAKSVRGVRATTRTNQMTECAQKAMEVNADRYNFVRDRMLRLGMPRDEKRFQPIAKTDLWMIDINAPRTRRNTKDSKGKGNKSEPWYWRIEWSSGSSEEKESWSVEADRVRWHRQRAERDRHTEEVEILKEELRRIMRSHKKFHDLWLSYIVKEPVTRLDLGRNAYASRTAAMHEDLRAHAEEIFRLATKPRFQFDLDSPQSVQ